MAEVVLVENAPLQRNNMDTPKEKKTRFKHGLHFAAHVESSV